MKKFLVLASVLAAIMFFSGCSSTWQGIKQDTHENLDSTKEAIHEVTE